jgi:hypothetical protein
MRCCKLEASKHAACEFVNLSSIGEGFWFLADTPNEQRSLTNFVGVSQGSGSRVRDASRADEFFVADDLALAWRCVLFCGASLITCSQS